MVLLLLSVAVHCSLRASELFLEIGQFRFELGNLLPDTPHRSASSTDSLDTAERGIERQLENGFVCFDTIG
jgi:hypothetical protein